MLLTVAGNRHRAVERHLVLAAVLRNLEQVWSELEREREREMATRWLDEWLDGQMEVCLPSVRQRSSRSP